MQFEFAAHDCGEQYSLALIVCFADEGVGADLVGQGVVEQYGRRPHIQRVCQQASDDAATHLGELLSSKSAL